MRANEKLLLCLCQTCVSQFLYSDGHIVKRVDPYKSEKDECVYCQVRMGYDFEIIKKPGKRGRRQP